MRYLFFVSFFSLLFLGAFKTHEGFTISGVVTDDAGTPLQGVTISMKGSSVATVTDAKGAFTLKVNSDKAKLVISFIGYDSQEIIVRNDGKPVSIKLTSSLKNMQEVVVTGYGARKKDVKALAKSSNTPPVAQMLAGRAPGVQVGGSPSIRLRGQSSSNVKHREDKRVQNWVGDADGENEEFDREGYDAITENRFLTPKDNPLSTFSIDVDAASYSNMRRFLADGHLPPAGAVRIEEMINYFHYDYPQPEGEDPFSINTEISDCPWNPKHKLALIGLQGKKIATENLPPSNLVFLIDVSGSMMDEDKLPLVQASMKLLVDQLRQEDKVAMVVYAGNAGLVLPSTNGSDKITIKEAIGRLQAGGSTAGGAGIQLAYKVAKDNFIEGGNNRIILCTDGDFNVGISSNDELETMIEDERKSGVFLTVLGYGTGNYQDSKMQRLADKGNGNHAYIDNLMEAKKVLVSEFGGTLFTIAKDVKLQIEFNPSKVQAYRLIGYENRLLNKEDFNNDKKDAGDLGSGHTVTALYEIIPVDVKSEFIEKVDPLKYQSTPNVSAGGSDDMMTIKFRYKKPDGNKSKLIEHAVIDNHVLLSNTSANFRFAAAVASFGMLLRNSEFKQRASYDQAWQLAKGALDNDEEGYRSEFLKLVKNAQTIALVTDKKAETVTTIRE
jgi:Ca-activated chloride channel family protein